MKTKSGKRELLMVGLAHRVLLAQQARQQAQYSKALSGWKGGDPAESLVFTTASGSPLEPGNLSRSFRRICGQAGVRRIRVHDLRHTNATFLKDLGVPDRDIQAMLGHSDGAMTRHYQHGNRDTSGDASARLAALLQAPTVVSGRSRQISRQSYMSLQRIQQFNLAGETGLEPATPSFGALIPTVSPTVEDRIQSVRTFMEGHTRRWLVGVVVVKLSRQIEVCGGGDATPGGSV